MKKITNSIIQKSLKEKIYETWQDALGRTVRLMDYRTLPSGIETLYEYDGESDRITSEVEINAGNKTKIVMDYNEDGRPISHKLFYGEDDLYQETRTTHTTNTAISEIFEEGERVGRIVESWEGNTMVKEIFDADDNLTGMEEITKDAENNTEEYLYYDEERVLYARQKMFFNEKGNEMKEENYPDSSDSPLTTVYEYDGDLLVQKVLDIDQYDSPQPGATVEVVYSYNDKQELVEIITKDAYEVVTSQHVIEYEKWDGR